MTRSRMPSQPPSWPYPLELQTENRLTRLELVQEDHTDTLDVHSSKHDEQATWNRGFTVALLGLGAGLAHAKADGMAYFLAALLKAWKP